MLLPTTYGAALGLLIISMLCWGSWANTQKLAGKWRFELFYYDFSIGMLLCAIVAAYTFGNFVPQELTFQDNLLLAAKHQMAWAIGAGMVFNLANLLLVAAIAVAGMAVAFPIGIGLALVIGVIGNYILNPQGSPLLLFGGVVLVLVAVVVNAFAYSAYADGKREQELKAAPGSRKRASPGAARGIVLSIAAGILMGVFYPMVEKGREGQDGVAPYGLALLFGAGVLLSSFFYVPFFLTFPVEGPSIEMSQYFKGNKKQHLLGLAGGILWMVGGLCNFASASTPDAVQVGPAVSYALGQGATLVSALWGLIVWREFKGASDRVKMLIAIMLVLFVSGLAMISLAPLQAR